MKSAQLPTQEYLRSILRYDPETGFLYWKEIIPCRINIGDRAGTLTQDGYISIKVGGRSYRAHRIICCMVYGEFPLDEVDHIDHIKHNNRLENIRLATRLENMRNQIMHITNTSGATGVCWDRRRCKWLARIHIEGKSNFLGYFKEKSDAIQARATANIKYRFHKNHGKPRV